MINPDDLDIQRPLAKLRDLQPMSIEELENYIRALRTEIERSDKMIEQKQAHKDGIDAIFGTRKD